MKINQIIRENRYNERVISPYEVIVMVTKEDAAKLMELTGRRFGLMDCKKALMDFDKDGVLDFEKAKELLEKKDSSLRFFP